MSQATAGLGKGRAFAGLLIVGLGTLNVPLDTSVNISFPDITDHFGIPIASIQWVVICYVLTYASLMLAFGKLGDLFGHKRIFVLGQITSAVALALCAAAPSFGWLLFFRGMQGVGSALALSCGPALATSLLPEDQRARALGTYTMMFGVGFTVGPSLGGTLVQQWGWEAVFWFRVPIALAALMALPWLRPVEGPRRGGAFDFAGAALLALGLSALLLAMNQVQSDPMRGIAVFALGFAGIAAFVWRESRANEPIIPLSVFRRLDFSMLNVVNSLVNLVGFSSLLLVPYYLVRATEFSLAFSGILLAAGPFGIALAGPCGGWLLSRRPWASRLALLSASLVAVSTMTIGSWPPHAQVLAICLPLFGQGVGLGLFQVCILDVVTGRLDVKDRGVAGSLAMVTRTIGTVLGATLLSLGFASLRGMEATAGLSAEAAFLSAFHTTFICAGAGLLACLAVTLLRPRLWFS